MKAPEKTPEAKTARENLASAELRDRIVTDLERASTIGAFRALVELSPLEALHWLENQAAPIQTEDPAFASGLSRAFAALTGRGEATEVMGKLAERYANILQSQDVLLGARALVSQGHDDAAAKMIEAAVERAPNDAGLLREMANRLVRAGDVQAHDWLSRLARAESGAATALRVYRTRSKLPRPEHRRLRVGLLSSYTIDTIVPHVDLELRDLELDPDLYVAPFDTWEREMLDPAAGLRRFDPEVVFLAVSIDDLGPELAGAVDAEGLAQIGEQALDRVLGAAKQFSSWSSAPLVVHGFHSAHAGPLGILEGRAGPSRSRWLDQLNASLAEALAEMPRAYLLDMTELIARRPSGPADNPKMRHMGAMRLSEDVSTEVARAYARYVAPLVGRTAKVVVLDLDNTLWGGVVGEDGLHGIKLADHGPGSEFQDLQRFLSGLSQRGILLAINSKNNAQDAWEVIQEHEGMILREKDFSAARINWQPKPENLMEIAAELNVGIDSMIFVDDNPNERERVRQFLPMVNVPELPSDPALYRRTLEALPELQHLEATTEDQQRVALYREKRERESARESVGSVSEYLETLAIEVDIASLEEATLPRVHQLFQRTNQFNTTTRRYEVGELEEMSADPSTHVYTLRARDRFGDHGLVGVAVVRTNAAKNLWRVDSFLMSCRVIGYGIETALLAVICEDAIAQGAARLEGEFIPTAKNAPVADLFSSHGFAEVESEGDLSVFERGLGDEPIERPDWLIMEVDGLKVRDEA